MLFSSTNCWNGIICWNHQSSLKMSTKQREEYISFKIWNHLEFSKRFSSIFHFGEFLVEKPQKSTEKQMPFSLSLSQNCICFACVAYRCREREVHEVVFSADQMRQLYIICSMILQFATWHYLWADWIRLTRARETRFAGGLCISSPNSCIAMHSLKFIMCVRSCFVFFLAFCFAYIQCFLLMSTCPQIVFGFSLSFHVCCSKCSMLWCISICCLALIFHSLRFFSLSFTVCLHFHSFECFGPVLRLVHLIWLFNFR